MIDDEGGRLIAAVVDAASAFRAARERDAPSEHAERDLFEALATLENRYQVGDTLDVRVRHGAAAEAD